MVSRLIEYIISISAFDNATAEHNGNLIGHIVRDTKVMRNKQICQSTLFLNSPKQIQYLCTHRYI